MKKLLSVLALVAVTSLIASATPATIDRIVPEIDANAAASAIALLSGALMVFRGRRRS